MPVYTIGVDGLNKQKVFDNVEKLLERWEKIAGVQGVQLTADLRAASFPLYVG
jgi:hypothetical protein